METIIAALITVIVPVALVSMGTVNRDKRDVKIRTIAKDLGMAYAVQQIDARRMERINIYVSQLHGVGSVVMVLNRSAYLLTAVGLLMYWIPTVKTFLEEDYELRNIAPWISGIGLVISLSALVVSLIYKRKVKKELEQKRRSSDSILQE